MTTAAPDPDPGYLAVRLERTALIAARLVHAVHTGTRADVTAALHAVPPADRVLLPVTLAAMVNPAADVTDLLAWCSADPGEMPPRRQARRLPREHGTPRGYWQHRDNHEPTCPECRAAHAVETRPQICRDEFARLRAEGVDVIEAANRSRTRDVLAAHAARAAAAGLRSIGRSA